MTIRKADAVWKGTLKEGGGTVKVGSGAFEVPYSYATRFGDEVGANPEELIGAAHAGCYSMYLSSLLTKAGHPPARIHTTASVHLEAGPTITKIELNTTAEVPGLDEAAFQAQALDAKKNCPVSKALASVEVVLTAKLVK